jgi:hypothetical protein
MEIHRRQRKHTHDVDPSTSSEKTKTRLSLFDGIDAAARSFLGPADRTDGHSPVVHLHDAAEESSDDTLRSIDVYTDSAGHHYAQRRVERRPSDQTGPATGPPAATDVRP